MTVNQHRETSLLDWGEDPMSPALPDKRVLSLDPSCTLQTLIDPADFIALAGEWDALLKRCNGQVFYSHGFLRLWRMHFAPHEHLRVLIQRAPDGRLTAALPLRLRRSRLHGIRVRELCAAANVHSSRFDMIAEDPPGAARAFLALLLNQDDWDVLTLIDVPEPGAAEMLLQAAVANELHIGRWASMNSPRITLPQSWSELEQTLSPHFRANLRRRRRRLLEQGSVSVELHDEPGGALMARLDEGLSLEAEGWKGKGGTAICQAADTLAFYTALAQQAARDGTLRLWFLRLDGQAIAFQFGLQDGSSYLLLKPAYDEAFGGYSPGQMLVEAVLKDCIARGLREFDFLGPDMPWKREWTKDAQRHNWLYVFRGPRGWLLRLLKFRIGPLVKLVSRAVTRM